MAEAVGFMALAAERAGIKNLFLPTQNAEEASFAERLVIYSTECILEILEHLQGKQIKAAN